MMNPWWYRIGWIAFIVNAVLACNGHPGYGLFCVMFLWLITFREKKKKRTGL